MFTPGDDASSATGTTLSPSPNGKNMSGTDESLRLLTVTGKSDTANNGSSVSVQAMSTCRVEVCDITGQSR